METIVFEQAVATGIWTVLFVALFFYVLKRNDKREDNYQKVIENNQKTIASHQKIIENLTVKFCLVEDIQRDISDIKDKLFMNKNRR